MEKRQLDLSNYRIEKAKSDLAISKLNLNAGKKVPESYQKDLQIAIDILKEEGCKEIYLFGSLVNGDFTGESDIDLAVKGLEKKFFFKTLGKLIMGLEHAVDLINLEKDDRFSTMLKKKGGLLRVA